MADFALWATAGEIALGLYPGQFIATYQGNRDSGNELALEASPVGKAVLDLVASVSHWEGTASDLLDVLDHAVDEKTQRLKSWPASARPLSGTLKRLAPNLRELGVEVEFTRETGGSRRRLITLSRERADSCVPCVPLRHESGISRNSVAQPPPPGTQGGAQNQGTGTENSLDGTQGDARDANLHPLSVHGGGGDEDDYHVDQWEQD